MSRICPEASRGRICIKFGFGVVVADVITCDKFFGNRSRGVQFVWGGESKISGSHRQSLSPLILCCLYRAASDKKVSM